MTLKAKRGKRKVRHVFETTLSGPIIGFDWWAPETSKLNAGDRVRVTVEKLRPASRSGKEGK